MARKRETTEPESFEDLVNSLAPGKSWSDVATLTHTSARTLWRLRHGRLERPTRVVMHNISAGLRCTTRRVEAAVRVTREAVLAS